MLLAIASYEKKKSALFEPGRVKQCIQYAKLGWKIDAEWECWPLCPVKMYARKMYARAGGGERKTPAETPSCSEGRSSNWTSSDTIWTRKDEILWWCDVIDTTWESGCYDDRVISTHPGDKSCEYEWGWTNSKYEGVCDYQNSVGLENPYEAIIKH